MITKKFLGNDDDYLYDFFGGQKKAPNPHSINRTERRIRKCITKQFISTELILAIQRKLYSFGNRSTANLVKQSIISPFRSSKTNKAYKISLSNGAVIPYYSNDALAFTLDNNLTKKFTWMMMLSLYITNNLN